MKNIQKTVCALAILATTSGTVMAESINVKVIGTITPTACKINLTGGGIFDYGVINPSVVKKDTYAMLDEKQLDMSITCDAPAKVAVLATAQGEDSAVHADGSLAKYVAGNNFFGWTDIGAAGLGKVGDQGIGGFGLRIDPANLTLDGNKADVLVAGNLSDWKKATVGNLFSTSPPDYISFGKTGTLDPVAFTTMAGKLSTQAFLNLSTRLDLTKPINLNGQATLELVYL